MDNLLNGLMQYRYAAVGKEGQHEIVETTASANPEREANIANATPTESMLPVTNLPSWSQPSSVSSYTDFYGQRNQTAFDNYPSQWQMLKAIQGFGQGLKLPNPSARKTSVKATGSFLQEFFKALGPANAEVNLGPGQHDLVKILADLVEREAERQTSANDSGWIEIAQRVLSISYLQSVVALATILGMNTKNLVQLISHPHALEADDNDCVRKVYAELVKRKSLKTGDVKEITGFGDTKAREILNELVEAGLAQQHGEGRGTRYVLADPATKETV